MRVPPIIDSKCLRTDVVAIIARKYLLVKHKSTQSLTFGNFTKKEGAILASLYERLDTLCKANGISGSRLGLEIGYGKSLMTDLKNGRKKSVNFETAQKIAAYFGVSVGYLLGEEDVSPVTREMNEKANLLAKITIKAQRDPQFMSDLQAFFEMDEEKRRAIIALIK